jgi:uncharacterized membrane protein
MSPRRILRLLTGVLFVLAGANHFANASFYVSIMPPYLPLPTVLVWASGACEIVLGCMLLVRRLRQVAGWGLIALLIAVFPANLHMALHPQAYPEFGRALLWWRLPLQAVLIALVAWVARARKFRPVFDTRRTSP